MKHLSNTETSFLKLLILLHTYSYKRKGGKPAIPLAVQLSSVLTLDYS